ncbi:MAG TPA: malto-oligosyltrehalose synthase [Rhizomicrobium sp.]|nr:malto-oligosyltrehalose synthase [Rhizomicrobium sp.]
MIPRATYRIQFRKEFTFENACAIVPYLARLGISHIYASPILMARKGSPHGYDVVDHAHISAELGGEDGFRKLVSTLKAHGLGLIVDIVPNHMAVGKENPWWMDVLAHGRASVHARAFDIDWEPPDPTLQNRVLLPVLGAPLAETLARGEIRVTRDEKIGDAVVAYADHRFPLRPEDNAFPDRTTEGGCRPDVLFHLLERQHYRLAWWRTAGDLINWRRFFDINDLVALRMEDDAVFEAVHAKPLALYAEGLIDGLRIDHVDGLADPRSYCRKLRGHLDRLRPGGYLVVEKILASDEMLPDDWGVEGTTGYDFMNDAAAVLHDPAGAHPLACAWAEISGRSSDFHAEEREARRELLQSKFHGAFEAVVRSFFHLAPPAAQDMTQGAVRRALLRLFAELRIYRTYIAGGDCMPPDAFFDSAVERALRRAPANDAAALQHVVQIFQNFAGEDVEERRVAVRRFNQLAASLAAKAGEDTALYRYGMLLSRNEVGSDPDEFSLAPRLFHMRARKRLNGAPLLATATHDHKRGEDARMRLAVLSEISTEWLAAIASWFDLNAPIRDSRLDRADEYQLYQTLVGSWPLDLDWRDAEKMGRFADRILIWRIKSLHEAKLRSSWSDPDRDYEEASASFVRRLLDPQRSADFLSSFAVFMDWIAPAAVLNGLVQTALRCSTPGVPDLYQGAEFWDFSLVDPDNRRPVDFAVRAEAPARASGPAELLKNWRSGEIKQHVIAQLLTLRKKETDCFLGGDYLPLEAQGRCRENIMGYVRSHDGTNIIVLVPRLCAKASIEAARPLPDTSFWKDTVVPLSAGLYGRTWRSLFDPEITIAPAHHLSCAELFRWFPVTVLVNS